MKKLILLLLLPSLVHAQRLNPERFYQDRWCNELGGQTEVIQEDRTRVDCVTYFHAIEFDFADKWAEALGQALHYGRMTGMAPGIVLIVEDPEDMRYVERLRAVLVHYNLNVGVWVTE